MCIHQCYCVCIRGVISDIDILYCHVEEDENDNDSGLVVMNQSTTAPSIVSDMEITGSQQPSLDCYEFNETMEPLPTATNALLENATSTTEASTQTSAVTAAVPAAGKVMQKYLDKVLFQKWHFNLMN